MYTLLPLTCLSLYLTLICLHLLMSRFTLTIPKTKFHFILPAVKSNVDRTFLLAERNFGSSEFYFGSHVNSL